MFSVLQFTAIAFETLYIIYLIINKLLCYRVYCVETIKVFALYIYVYIVLLFCSLLDLFCSTIVCLGAVFLYRLST